MATLKRLRRSLDAGEMIERMEDHRADGYEAVWKEGEKYIWLYSNIYREEYDTFDELYTNAEPDHKVFTQEELDTWEVASELTDEEQVQAQEFLDILESGDAQAKRQYFREGAATDLERTLFQTKIKDRQSRKRIIGHITSLRTPE